MKLNSANFMTWPGCGHNGTYLSVALVACSTNNVAVRGTVTYAASRAYVKMYAQFVS